MTIDEVNLKPFIENYSDVKITDTENGTTYEFSNGGTGGVKLDDSGQKETELEDTSGLKDDTDKKPSQADSDLPKVGKKDKNEVEAKAKLKDGTNLPTSLKFGPGISITDIETENKSGKYYSTMTMNGKTYTVSSNVTKNAAGVEKYVLNSSDNDGSKIVVEREADGVQYYTVYDSDGKAISKLHLNKNGKPRSIFRFKNGYAYEREYNDGVVRRYTRDENNKLVSSLDYKRDDSGNINEDKPLSKQTYVHLDGIGSQWSSRVLYEYNDDGSKEIKETEKYTYKQEMENGVWNGEITITKDVYSGDSVEEKDLIQTSKSKYIEGVLQESEENEKDKKTTKVKRNSDGSTTTVITEGDKKTVIEKDKNGNITSKKVTENGITKTTTYKNGEESGSATESVSQDGLPQNVQSTLTKIQIDKLPAEVQDAIGTVSETFKNGNETTKSSEEQDREKEEGEDSNKYKSNSTNEGGKQVTYTSGKQEFPESDERKTNTYTEIYEGENIEGQQLGGYGIIEYRNGEYEIHYDKFEDGKIKNSKGVIINENEKTITYYTINSNGKEEKTVYNFDGTKKS